MHRRKPPTRWRTTRRPREGEAWPRRIASGLLLKAGRGRFAGPVFMPTTRIASALRVVRPSVPRWRGRGFDGAPPQWAGRVGLRPDLLRQVAPVRAVFDAGGHRPRITKDGPPTPPHGLAMELPSHASSRWPHAAAGAFPPVVGVLALSASGRKPVKPIRGDAESATAPFGAVRPLRPCFVVNPGGGMAVPRASWPQPSGANNFPSATRIPRAANSLRLPVLHCVSAASGATRPTPADRITTRTRWARPC